MRTGDGATPRTAGFARAPFEWLHRGGRYAARRRGRGSFSEQTILSRRPGGQNPRGPGPKGDSSPPINPPSPAKDSQVSSSKQTVANLRYPTRESFIARFKIRITHHKHSLRFFACFVYMGANEPPRIPSKKLR